MVHTNKWQSRQSAQRTSVAVQSNHGDPFALVKCTSNGYSAMCSEIHDLTFVIWLVKICPSASAVCNRHTLNIGGHDT